MIQLYDFRRSIKSLQFNCLQNLRSKRLINVRGSTVNAKDCSASKLLTEVCLLNTQFVCEICVNREHVLCWIQGGGSKIPGLLIFPWIVNVGFWCGALSVSDQNFIIWSEHKEFVGPKKMLRVQIYPNRVNCSE